MKRFMAVWLVAALCAALIGSGALAEDESGIAVEMAEDAGGIAVEMTPDAALLPEVDADLADVGALDLQVDLEALELLEPEAADASEDLQPNAPEAGDIASNKIIQSKLIRYEVSGDEATVVSADRAITDANIPETIKGYEVRHIAAAAFAGCKDLWTVTIPETVTDIGEDAFSNCAALVNVQLPDGLEEIGPYAFKNCTKLSHIDLPEGLTVISKGLFENCQILWRITIPSSVVEIGEGAFYKCLMLKNFTLPEGLQTMGKGAFELCEEMKQLEIPASLATIPERAFRSCTNLRKVTLHSGLKTVADGAFFKCDSLRTLKLPASVTTVGRFAFAYNEYLRTLNIPGSVESLGYGAFFHCLKLEEVCLKSGVDEIGDYCFAHCGRLVKVEIPESVTMIGDYAFMVGYSTRIDENDMVLLSKPLHLPKKLKIYGRPASAASAYASAWHIPFVIQKILATSVSIAEGKSATLYMGHTLQLTAIQEPANAETKLKWSSSSSSVSVSKTGLLTPKRSGKATITVRTENGKKATFSVKVVDANSVSIDQGKSVTMKVGETLQLSATVLPEQVLTKLTWSSGSKSIATVSKSGLVLAKKKGTVTITVKTANGRKAKIKIKVTA